MARTREFNEANALERAMELFWHKGYAETSMRDIAAHTGVSHAGLYGAFGDKRDLFKKTLRLYDQVIGAKIIGPLEAPDAGRTEIEALFYMVLGFVIAGQFENGCLMCNTAVEFGDESGDVLGLAQANLIRMADAFEAALARAEARGEVRDGLDPKATAAFLTAIFHGVSVMSRAQMPSDYVKSTILTALAVLD